MAKQSPKKQMTKSDRFWSSFLFTENGKVKSGFLVYTFSLSFACLMVYALSFEGVMRLLTAPLSTLNNTAANFIVSMISGAIGAALCCIPHRFFKDKRLIFGAHLWLLAYLITSLITLLIQLKGDGIGTMLLVLTWFGLIPVVFGLALSGYLWHRYRKPVQKPVEEEPEWKKYVNRY